MNILDWSPESSDVTYTQEVKGTEPQWQHQLVPSLGLLPDIGRCHSRSPLTLLSHTYDFLHCQASWPLCVLVCLDFSLFPWLGTHKCAPFTEAARFFSCYYYTLATSLMKQFCFLGKIILKSGARRL